MIVKLGVKSESTCLTRVGSPRVELKIGELNPTHFLVSQKFYNSVRPTMGWWVNGLSHL